jgi:hypothetical protein
MWPQASMCQPREVSIWNYSEAWTATMSLWRQERLSRLVGVPTKQDLKVAVRATTHTVSTPFFAPSRTECCYATRCRVQYHRHCAGVTIIIVATDCRRLKKVILCRCSGLRRRVDLWVGANVSEKNFASIFRADVAMRLFASRQGFKSQQNVVIVADVKASIRT